MGARIFLIIEISPPPLTKTPFGNLPEYRATWGIAAMLSQYIARYGATKGVAVPAGLQEASQRRHYEAAQHTLNAANAQSNGF